MSNDGEKNERIHKNRQAVETPTAAATSRQGLCTARRGFLGSQINREGMRVFDYLSVTVHDTRILHKSRKWDPSPFLLRVVHRAIHYSHLHHEYGSPLR